MLMYLTTVFHGSTASLLDILEHIFTTITLCFVVLIEQAMAVEPCKPVWFLLTQSALTLHMLMIIYTLVYTFPFLSYNVQAKYQIYLILFDLTLGVYT